MTASDRIDDYGILVLSGGEATRLPGKLLLEAEHMPMLARVIRNVSPSPDDARPRQFVLSANTSTLASDIAAMLAPKRPLTLVVDRWAKRGPLGGILSAFPAMDAPFVFVVAGDAPFVDREVIARLVAAYEPGDEALVPTHDDPAERSEQKRIEPLAAMYDRLAFVREGMPILHAGRGALHLVISRLRARFVTFDEPSIFANVNTPDDYAAFRDRVAAAGAPPQITPNLSTRPLRFEEPPMTRDRSSAAFDRAKKHIPGGVNSPVRAFKGVGGSPVFVREASGARFTDLDGNTYIDCVMSWGPLILGHADPRIIDAVQRAAARGTSYGAPTEAESDLAELVVAMVPSVDMVRFCSSGTEATMSALRLARGFTGRDKVVKFAGCYHGHGDSFLISAGSGALTMGTPDSPGITQGTARDTIVVPYNDLAALRAAFEREPSSIACVIVEPYVGNMGLVLPEPGYLAGLRALCTEFGALLIFDEVMTGFRVAPGGVQEREGVTPDLTTLGKVIGGGLPVGAFGGRAEIMEELSPLGAIYQAGTLSGNPLAMAAGRATLEALREPGVYERLEAAGARFTTGMTRVFDRHGIAHFADHRGSMVGFFFTANAVVDLASAKTADTAFYAKFFHAMLDRGVYLAPSQFEAGFLSLAHDDATLDALLEAADDAVGAVLAPA